MARFVFIAAHTKQKKYGNKQEKALDSSWRVIGNRDYCHYRHY